MKPRRRNGRIRVRLGMDQTRGAVPTRGRFQAEDNLARLAHLMTNAPGVAGVATEAQPVVALVRWHRIASSRPSVNS